MPDAVEDHEPGCILDPVHWLRHALGAAQRLLAEDPEPATPYLDRRAAVALLDELERHAEFDGGWRTVTLYEVTKRASLMGDLFADHCKCKPKGGPTT
jgi:hypothetical protein